MGDLWDSLLHFVQLGLAGGAAPWIIFLALVLTSFLLEDLSLAVGAVLATQGSISWEFAFLAVAGGIALGDLGLFGLGYLAQRISFLRHRYIDEKRAWAREALLRHFIRSIALARVLPGLRLVTYSAAGYLRIPFLRFSAWVMITVSLWTASVFVLSAFFGEQLAQHLNAPAPLMVGLLVIALALVVPILRWLRRLAL